MQGRLSTTRLLSTAHAAPAPSTRPGPASAAAGPAITSPNMPTPNPPNVENELARDTRSAGTCCCRVVVQYVLNSALAMPAANAPAATAPTAACSARRKHGAGYPNVARIATISGRRGRRPSADRPPSTAPAPPAAMTSPQALAPPRYALASTGPSSRYGPQVMRLNSANCSVVTQSQVRDRNSAHPSPASRRSDRCVAGAAGASAGAGGGAGARCGGRSSARAATLIP
jgi:hypothetical protein